MHFDELELNDNILDALYSMRFDTCTPIQEKAIPPLLEGKDMVGIAQTGTGKTAAYLLPIINRLYTEEMPTDAINCVIMAPTRELAQQIDQQLEAFSYFIPVSGLAVYGGNDGGRYDQEVKSMQLGADILIATPGRLLSHIALGNVDLSHVSMFVLDEADRMLDMGFIDDINKIVSHLPQQRQTLLFSATMPNEIQKLARTILKNPVSIELAIAKPAEKIDQSAYVCYEAQKTEILKTIFKDKELKRVIIFSSSKKKVKDLTYTLKKMKLNVCEMHSDLSQKERDDVLRAFKSNNIDIIISTDLLSRGIDIDDIEMVINYDVPHNADDYVHRIGRTARANRYGKAITLINEEDQYFFGRIEKVIEKTVRKEPLPESLHESPVYLPGKNKKSNSNKNHNRGKKTANQHSPKNSSKTPQDRNSKKPSSGSRHRNKARFRKDKNNQTKNGEA